MIYHTKSFISGIKHDDKASSISSWTFSNLAPCIKTASPQWADFDRNRSDQYLSNRCFYRDMGKKLNERLRVRAGANLPYKEGPTLVGISVGTFNWDHSTVNHIVQTALKVTTSRIEIMVAGTLDIHNLVAFGRSGYTPHMKNQAKERESDIIHIFEDVISNLPEEKERRIGITGWDPVHEDDGYLESVDELRHAMKTIPEIKELVELTAISFFKLRAPQKTYREKRRRAVIEYILEELPAVLKGIDVEGINYHNILHPVFYKSSNKTGPVLPIFKLVHFLTFNTSSEISDLRRKIALKEPPVFVDVEMKNNQEYI